MTGLVRMRRGVALGGAAGVIVLALAAIVLTHAVLRHGVLSWLDGEWRDGVLARRGPVLTEVMLGATSFGSAPSLLVMAFAVAVWLLWRGHRLESLLVLGATAGMLLGPVLKQVTGRPRPVATDHVVLVDSWSYPSSHSLNSMVVLGVFAVLALRTRPRPPVRVIVVVVGAGLVATIGFSRVYLGVHWPSDVLAGWLIGLLWLTVCCTVAQVVREYRRVGYGSDE